MKRIQLSELALKTEEPSTNYESTIEDSDKASGYMQALSEVQQAVSACQRCIIITGAGISVSSGIPDFRSPDGLFQQLKQKYPQAVTNGRDLFDAMLFRDPELIGLFYNFMGELRNIVRQANCTPTHNFIKSLDDHGKLLRCYTQNIDSLEKRVGLETSLKRSSDRAVVLEEGKPSDISDGLGIKTGTETAADVLSTANGSNSLASSSPDQDPCSGTITNQCPSLISEESNSSNISDSNSSSSIDTPLYMEDRYKNTTMGDMKNKDNGAVSSTSKNKECLSLQRKHSSRTRKRQTTIDKAFPRAVQLHGDLDNVVCTICYAKYPFSDKIAEEFCEGSPPSCPNCKEIGLVRDLVGKRSVASGVLRPDIVLYNECHPQGELIGTLNEYDLKRRPDLLIVIGTSLKIPGVKRMIREMSRSVHMCTLRAKKAGAGKTIFINRDDPPKGWDTVFDYFISGNSDEAINLLPILSKKPEKRTIVAKTEDNTIDYVQRVKERMSINTICSPEIDPSITNSTSNDSACDLTETPVKNKMSTVKSKKRKTVQHVSAATVAGGDDNHDDAMAIPRRITRSQSRQTSASTVSVPSTRKRKTKQLTTKAKKLTATMKVVKTNSRPASIQKRAKR